MSTRKRLIVSIVCGVFAVLLMAGYAAGVRGEAEEQRRDALKQFGGSTAVVCVATRDIAQGETFSERNVAAVEWLVDLLPNGVVSDLGSLAGKTASASVAKNTPISSVCVSAQDVAVEVPEGLVAVSVPCSNESAVGGTISAGSVVDVYVVDSGAARMLSREVQVLKTSAGPASTSLSWAVLAVDPSEVEAMIAASSVQRLYFVLPSSEEIGRRAVEGAAAPASSGYAAGSVDAVAPADPGVEAGDGEPGDSSAGGVAGALAAEGGALEGPAPEEVWVEGADGAPEDGSSEEWV